MSTGSKKEHPYHLHRLALHPLLPTATDEHLERAREYVASGHGQTFLQFLLQQGLGPLWDALLERKPDTAFPEDLRHTLHQARLDATGRYLIQHNRLKDIREILEAAAIDHVVFKGAAFRDQYYSEPALRPALDIDALVRPGDKVAATRAFRERGFEFHARAKDISHEANLLKGKSSIDLHWDILRPGRTRVPMVDALLEARQDADTFWALSTEGALFIMLVHPVFTKYATTPHAKLVRSLDLVGMLDNATPDWDTLYHWLDESGMRTAAWITLRHLQLLTGRPPPEALAAKIHPGTLKARYLDYWLNNNLATRYLDSPNLVKLAFTLPAHDRIPDAIRATLTARNLSQAADSELQLLRQQLER